ncbi:hypothetical protein AQ616_18805 [Oceanobacillus sp. E9]|uniref:hypothetical protein n=1 Tax=Oceanobacillus sp. E9 TaxID=1742575 RepID=UPI00084EB055|nr:hypothetical protein [Oceanobacillus sp. E9]OEH52956.1 hypothetical protein AQ616_18805 [Oceanobacillus sp. E9]
MAQLENELEKQRKKQAEEQRRNELMDIIIGYGVHTHNGRPLSNLTLIELENLRINIINDYLR